MCERECGCAAGLACLSYLRIYLGSFDRIPSNCVINVFITLPVGGAASSSMLLCTLGVTDVRRNVWVLRSLLTVSAESCHSAPLHHSTPPLPPPRLYPPPPRTRPHLLQPKRLDGRQSGVKRGSFLTSSITPPRKIPPSLPVSGESMGRDPAGRLKQVPRGAFHLRAAFHVFMLLSNAACSFALARLRPCMLSSRDCGERSRKEKEKCHGETGILLVSIHPGRVPFGS